MWLKRPMRGRYQSIHSLFLKKADVEMAAMLDRQDEQ